MDNNRKARQGETRVDRGKYENDADKQRSAAQSISYEPQQVSSRKSKKKYDHIDEMQSNRKKITSDDVEREAHESIFSSLKPSKISTPSEKYAGIFVPRTLHTDRAASRSVAKEVDIQDQTLYRGTATSTRESRHRTPHINQTRTSLEALGSLSPERSSRLERSSKKSSKIDDILYKALVSPERARETEDILHRHRDHEDNKAKASTSSSRVKRRDPSPSLRPLPIISSPASNYLKPTQSTLAKKIDRAGYIPTTISAVAASPRQTVPFLLGKSLAPSYSIYSGPYAPLDPIGDYFKVDKKMPLHSKKI